MRQELNDPHLNLFRHYGDHVYHEDNVTRALWTVLARSSHGEEITRRLLALLADQPDVPDAMAQDLRSLPWDEALAFEMQRTGPLPDADSFTHRILLVLAPSKGEPDPPDAPPASSRPDGVLYAGPLVVLFENKIWTPPDETQLAQHRRNFFGEHASTEIRITWPQMIEFFQRLPPRLIDSLLVNDFLEFLSSLPHLCPSFTGLTPQDLSHPDWRTDTRLMMLAREVVRQSDSIAKEHRLSGGHDWDIYPVDQLNLVGNLGFACWGPGAFTVKIAAGNTTIQEPGVFTEQARLGGRYGIDRICERSADPDYVTRFGQAIELVPSATVSVCVRLKRGNKEDWHVLEQFDSASVGANPDQVFERLRNVHPLPYQSLQPQDNVLDAVRQANADVDVDRYRPRPGAARRSGFYQYGALVVDIPMTADAAKTMSAQEQIAWTIEQLEILHGVLRELSS